MNLPSQTQHGGWASEHHGLRVFRAGGSLEFVDAYQIAKSSGTTILVFLLRHITQRIRHPDICVLLRAPVCVHQSHGAIKAAQGFGKMIKGRASGGGLTTRKRGGLSVTKVAAVRNKAGGPEPTQARRLSVSATPGGTAMSQTSKAGGRAGMDPDTGSLGLVLAR